MHHVHVNAGIAAPRYRPTALFSLVVAVALVLAGLPSSSVVWCAASPLAVAVALAAGCSASLLQRYSYSSGAPYWRPVSYHGGSYCQAG
jgi:hypothetical protein